MSKDLYKNSLLVVLLLFFYYKQKEDIDVYLNGIMHQFSNIKYVINNYLSIILNDKNKKILKKKINNVKNYFFKNSENLALKEETKNIVEIVLPEKINVEDINVIDLKKTKGSNSIFNILLNKYIILSVILAINYYKRKLINKSSIISNKKSDELDIFKDDIKDNNEDEYEDENKDEYENDDDYENNYENEDKDINTDINNKENEYENINDDKSTNSEEDYNKEDEITNSDEDKNTYISEDDSDDINDYFK